jgi:hypothetical protein
MFPLSRSYISRVLQRTLHICNKDGVIRLIRYIVIVPIMENIKFINIFYKL